MAQVFIFHGTALRRTGLPLIDTGLYLGLGRRGRDWGTARSFGPDVGQIGRPVSVLVISVCLGRQRRHLTLGLPQAPVVGPHRLQFIATILQRPPPPSLPLGPALSA